jgi:hypothetical protein
LFAPKPKALKKHGNKKYSCGARIFLNVLEVKNTTNSFIYEVEVHSMYLNSI